MLTYTHAPDEVRQFGANVVEIDHDLPKSFQKVYCHLCMDHSMHHYAVVRLHTIYCIYSSVCRCL